MKGRLSTKLAATMAVVAVLTAVLALPAAIVYTEHRLAGLPPALRDRATAQIELNSWDDFDGLAEWGAVSLIAATAAVGIGWLLARRIVRPLGAISATARRLADGDLEARSGVSRRDELGQLASNFDAMAEDLQRLERERRTAAAVISHELRTPVTIARARLQAASEGLLELDEGEFAVLIDQLDGLTRIIEDLRILSLATAGRLTLYPERLDLTEVVAAQVTALAPLAAERDVGLVFARRSKVTTNADRDRLAQAISNLIINAIRHSPPHGEVVIECQVHPGSALAEITISDSGPGFSPAIGDPFEPFSIGGEPNGRSQRSGLGLTVVKAIADSHVGQVKATTRPDGATVSLTLPTDPT